MTAPDLFDELAAALGASRRIETHVSHLLFVAGRVLKLKKAVNLGFIDATTLARRLHFCEEEVRLNRRLAPDVYDGVAPVLRGADGQLGIGVCGARPAEAIEWAVVMCELPAARMLSALVARGEVDAELLERLAELLAEFHGRAAGGSEIDVFGEVPAVAANVRGNFEALVGFPDAGISPVLLDRLRRRAEQFLTDRAELLRRRVVEGRIRDGHGDLHAENICVLEDGIVAYDALEFSAALRCADVACDLGFLTMDLDRRGFPAFARDLARRYARRTGDDALLEVLPFYEDYRALVRAKVAAFTGEAEGASADLRAKKRLELREYLHLACRRGLGPALICTCGLPASGKSTVGEHVARSLDAAYHASDVRRKQLAGLAPDARVRPGVDQGLYAPENRARTYASLSESAADDLAAGRRVVIDATFARAADRAPFRALAAERGVPFFLLWVEAGEDETRRRLAARAGDVHAASDADVSVWERARAQFEAPEEVGVRELFHLRSGARPLEEDVGELLERWEGAG